MKGFLSIHPLEINSNEVLTFPQLKEKEGTDLKDLGTWQIGTILFTGESKAILTTDGKELAFPVEITNEEKMKSLCQPFVMPPKILGLPNKYIWHKRANSISSTNKKANHL
ncbi:hypothetical protein ACNZ61_003007 [Enterococcus hirae]